MIIPTLRIMDHDKYIPIVKEYIKQNIHLMRVNISRHTLKRYIDDILFINRISGGEIQIMADIPLPGKKYRLLVPDEYESKIEQDSAVCFSAMGFDNKKAIPVNCASFKDVSVGETILIGDGEVEFFVNAVTADEIAAIAVNSGVIRGQRAFCIPGSLSYNIYNDEELHRYIDFFEIIRPVKAVLSFSENIKTLTDVAKQIQSDIPDIQIIPKIETAAGVLACEKICSVFDEIMLGRGDLAIFSDVFQFGESQNTVLTMAQHHHTNAIAATDILTSLYTNHIPSRGELTDLYYLKTMGVRDIVASAGISMNPNLFSLFCSYTESFNS